MTPADRKILEMLERLDPATYSYVKTLKLHLKNGNTYITKDVTVERNTVSARHCSDPMILVVGLEEIAAVEAEYDLSALAADDIEATVEAMLAHAATN